MLKRRIALLLALVITVTLVLSCSTRQPRREELIRKLYERVELLWNAGIEKDIQTIYEMQTPEFREKISPIEYARIRKDAFRTIDFNIDHIELDDSGERAKVYVTNTFLAPYMPKPKTMPSQESTWVLQGGEWYVWTPIERDRNLSGRRAMPSRNTD